MEKKISFVMNDGNVTIKITTDTISEYKKEYTIKNCSLNAKAIYDLLDYELGDKYIFEEIQAEGKDKCVLEELMKFFESITNQIMNLDLLQDFSGFEQENLNVKD
ncbi:MAG: hypothetical protein PUC84_04175 [Clostridiales bacterium]|nr:hypothetical protein [Clostridiales bacterium]